MAEEKHRRRRSEKYEQTPGHAEQAAERMNAVPTDTGSFRGFVPQNQPVRYQTQPTPVQGGGQNTGAQPPAYPMNGLYMQTPPSGSGAWTASQQRFQTASNGVVGGFRGYVAVPDPLGNPIVGTGEKKKKSVFSVIATVLAVLVLLSGGAFAAYSYVTTNRINDRVEPYNNLFVNGVYVDGIHLGGMTPEQALNSVQSQIQQRNDAWSVTLTFQGETEAVINAGMLGMSVDIGEVMNNAWLQGHEGTNEERYEAMDALEANPYQAYTATPSGDTSVIDALLRQIKDRIDLAPVDAALTGFDTTQPYPFLFQEDRAGRRLNTEPLVKKLYQMVSTMQSGAIELEPEILEPAVTLIDLQKHYMMRSSVYTPISTSSPEERNNNIRRAFELVNGYVLNPGKSFSFNSVVGERTEKNGFFPAVEYAYNEHVMGIGGGVCQASTTLYQAAVCAGLQIVKREPHSDSVSYTEYGKDATVYWVGKRKIDLVFRNNTDESGGKNHEGQESEN